METPKQSSKTDFIQQSFIGGLNQEVDPTRIDRDQYPLLINGRNRYGNIEPVKLPLEIMSSEFPAGIMQGTFAAGNILIVFVAGQAYYKDWEYPNSSFLKINGFALSPDAPVVFAEAVPISYMNFGRTPEERSGTFNTDILLSTITAASPQGIVCQDGINPPQIITSAMTARTLNNYAKWELTNREYVPVGRQMRYINGVLWIVSADGRRLYRSVTGRPLDFMVIIKPISGDKYPTEEEGGAANVAHTVDYDVITVLERLNTDDGSFYVSTNKISYAVTPNYDKLVLGEPTFRNRTLFSTGGVSSFCFVEMLGDNAFADFNGLRSFNAILQTKNEGRNSPFGKRLGPILQGIQQDYVAAIVFDNYALFGLNTIYGRGIVVYDELREQFSAVDYYTGVGQIKQFAEIKVVGNRYLFFITTDDKLFLWAGSEDTARCHLYIGEWCSGNPELEQHIDKLKLVFIDSKEAGTVFATSYVDGKAISQPLSATLEVTNSDNPSNISVPFGDATTDRVKILSFDFGRTLAGWKAGFLVSWNFQAKLSHAALYSDVTSNINSVETAATSYKALQTALG